MCGGGTRSRSATCKHINGDGILESVNELACNYLGAAIAEETCNADVSCPEWSVMYNECSVTCGGGKVLVVLWSIKLVLH